MGSGKRHICCCDSSSWCDFIKWTYIICGVAFLLSAVLILYHKDELAPSPTSSSINGPAPPSSSAVAQLAKEREKRLIYDAIKSSISGAFCIAMGILVWWGTNTKGGIFLLCYIIIQLVLCAFSVVSLLGGVIVHDNRSGLYELTALPATLLAFLFVWIVDIQRKEISQDSRPMYQQQLQQARQQLQKQESQQQPLERVRVSSDLASSPDDSVQEAPASRNPNKEP